MKGNCESLERINGDFIQLLWKNPSLSIFEADIAQLQNEFIEVRNVINDDLYSCESKLESFEPQLKISSKWIAANIFLHFGLAYIIDKHLFLQPWYEVVLTDVNGKQLVPQYNLSFFDEIQWEIKK